MEIALSDAYKYHVWYETKSDRGNQNQRLQNQAEKRYAGEKNV